MPQIHDVPEIIQQMAPHRQWVDPVLKEAAAEASRHGDSPKQLRSPLALLPVDRQTDFIFRRLLDARPEDVPVIRDALYDYRKDFVERLWTIVEQPAPGREDQRLTAACALAAYAPNDSRWKKDADGVVEHLVSVNPIFLGLRSDGFRPVRREAVRAAPCGFSKSGAWPNDAGARWPAVFWPTISPVNARCWSIC